MENDKDKLLSAAEAGDVLGVSTLTVNRWREKGLLRAVEIKTPEGARPLWVFRAEDVQDRLDRIRRVNEKIGDANGD